MPEIRYVSPKQHMVSAVESRGDGEPGRITGYASVFYDGTPETEYRLWSDVVERVMPGAFDGPLGRPDDVRALFNHDANQVLGRVSADTLSLSVDDVGLRYSIVPGETRTAKDVIEHIKRGDVQGSSFAFIVTDQDWRTENSVDIREIRGVELFDVGPVTFPAYESTTAKAAKRGGVPEEDSEAFMAWQVWRKRRSERLAALRVAAARTLG